ncbi:cation:proton antiporter [Salipaludibacillus neizhouensis]|uniref:cation:proton antiporter n=1 Tax=Salipaludibacillus neizhouensis TaxID=885475 RepID=UPI001CBA6428|nr:cation:proton antiporter [Salipaludibacillus neizhouensis]
MNGIELPIVLTAGIVLLLLFCVGFIGIKIKIPGVILYILLGIVIGGLFTDNHLLYIAGEIGIILLFFMLGMEFPVKRLIQVAKKIAPAGFLDVLLSLGVTTAICLLFGLDWITAFLIGGIAYATSSSITAKMLESSKRMANPESEYMLGILIFEDLVAPIVVAILVGLTAGDGVTGLDFSIIVLKIVLLTVFAVLLGTKVFSKLNRFCDKYVTEDVFILFIVGIALSYGGLALYLDLSEVLGAFLAGIILAETKRTEPIDQLLLPIRDLLLPLFFLYFGTSIVFGEIPMLPLLIIVFVWSIIAKIIIGIVGGKWFGLSKKVSLRAGLSMTSRGEFSVIIASLATAPIALFSSIFILASATVGIVLFVYAPKITNKIYPKKIKVKETAAT